MAAFRLQAALTHPKGFPAAQLLVFGCLSLLFALVVAISTAKVLHASVPGRAWQPWPASSSSSAKQTTFHLVVAQAALRPYNKWLQWIKHVQLPNTQVFLYVRHELWSEEDQQLVRWAASQLSCGMTLTVVPLLPNKGTEIAVYLTHILKVYDDPPDGIAFLHGHGPDAWHADAGPFFRRLRAFHGGLVIRAAAASSGSELDAAAAAAAAAAAHSQGGLSVQAALRAARLLVSFSSLMVTLASGCKPYTTQIGIRDGCCAWVFCGSLPACQSEPRTCNGTLAGQRFSLQRHYGASWWDDLQARLLPLARRAIWRRRASVAAPQAAVAAPISHEFMGKKGGSERDMHTALDACNSLLNKHQIRPVLSQDLAGGGFFSSANTFITLGQRLQTQPKSFYADFLLLSLSPAYHDFYLGRCWEYAVWRILGGDSLDEAGQRLYVAVDTMEQLGLPPESCPSKRPHR